jgi:hypothetical protein
VREAEGRELDYLFKLKLTKNVKKLIERAFMKGGWSDAGQGWQGKMETLRLVGWSRQRKVVVRRHRLKDSVAAQVREGFDQLRLSFGEVEDDTELYEYAVLSRRWMRRFSQSRSSTATAPIARMRSTIWRTNGHGVASVLRSAEAVPVVNRRVPRAATRSPVDPRGRAGSDGILSFRVPFSDLTLDPGAVALAVARRLFAGRLGLAHRGALESVGAAAVRSGHLPPVFPGKAIRTELCRTWARVGFRAGARRGRTQQRLGASRINAPDDQ